MAATEPIRDKNQFRQLAEHYLKRGQLGARTALRISDLLRLKWGDVYDENLDDFRAHVTLTERKTGKRKTIALNKRTINALRLLKPHKRGEFIFASNRKDNRAISRVQAWRIIRAAVRAIGIAGKIACHSLRKMWGYHAWRSDVSPGRSQPQQLRCNTSLSRHYAGRFGPRIFEFSAGLTRN